MRRMLLLVLPIVLLFGVAPIPANGAGVLDLDRIPTELPGIEVLGASPAGVLYKLTRNNGEFDLQNSTWLKPTGGTAYQVGSGFDRLAGSWIFALGSGRVVYQRIGSTVTGSCDSSPQPAAVAPFGWIGAGGERVEIGATGCVVTTVYPQPDGTPSVADEFGYIVVKQLDDDGNRSFTYYSYADPTHPRLIADAGHHRWPNGLALRGKVVTWAVGDYTVPSRPDTSYVMRSSTDGSVAPTLTTVQGIVLRTSILGAATGWDACYFQSAVCASGSIGPGTATHVLNGTHSVFSDGAHFIFDTYGASPGVDAATAVDATTPRNRIVSVPLFPAVAYKVSLGPGGVAYIDNQPAADSVMRRLYTRSGSTVVLSAQTRIGRTNPDPGGAGWRLVSRDGRRTAYVDEVGDLWLVTDDGVRTKVFTASPRVAVVGGESITLSGSRLLWLKAIYDGDRCDMRPPPYCDPVYLPAMMLYDLRTGVSTQVKLPTGSPFVELWGNYLAYSDLQHAIWRRDLHSGAVLQVKAPGTARVNSLAVHSDYVAWSTCVPGQSRPCDSSVISHRNMTTRAAAIQLPSANTQQVLLSGGHVVYDTYPDTNQPDSGVLRVWRLATKATGVVGPIRGYSPSFDVHDETLAWTAPDHVARIGPNSPFVDYPKYLGNGSAPASFDPALRTWNPEFGISKALPTCTLTIKSGTTVRRVLGCATTTGSARALWNGRDSAGRLLPKGTYTWTLAGRDADGTLRWWTGATHPISGTVRIV